MRALDRFRATLNIDRFVVLAHGASGWIAMRYAVTYPKRCAGLVLLDTSLDKQAYAEALQRALDLPEPPRFELWFLWADRVVVPPTMGA